MPRYNSGCSCIGESGAATQGSLGVHQEVGPKRSLDHGLGPVGSQRAVLKNDNNCDRHIWANQSHHHDNS